MQDKPATSEVRSNLEKRCRDCQFCHGAGLVTIFHEKYTGIPFVELRRPDGQIRRYATRTAVPCVCALGFWVRDARQDQHATHRQEIDLQRVIEGTIRWSMIDPTLPYIDDSIVPDWRAVRAMLAKAQKPFLPKVYPKSAGNRISAYREMNEPIPGYKPTADDCDVPF